MYMNRKGFVFALVGFLLVFSCTKPEVQPDNPDGPASKDAITLSSPNSIVIPVEGGSATISFTASGDWTAAVANDRGSWLSISPASGGKDAGSIIVSTQANPDTDDRSAVVRLTCGKATASVTVTQKQKDALTQTPSKTQFGAEGGTFTIEVKANITYIFEIEGDWIHQTGTKAMSTKSTTFTVDKNEDTRKREGSVTVKSSLGSEKVTIYQEASAPSIILSSDSVPVGTEGGTFTVDVNTNVDVSMAIIAGADWLSEATTKAMSTHSYTFVATANESNDPREGKITFKNEEHGIEATVTVTQMQKDALIIAQPVYEIGADGGSISIEATSNVDLDIRASESWVRQTTTKAMTTKSYDFIVDPNPGYDTRECVITFSGGSGNQQQSQFQDASPWSVIGSMGGDTWTRDIEMKTDGTWHAAYGIAVSSSDEFKFRRDGGWSTNFGYAAYQTTTVASNTEVPMWQDGGNLKLDTGTYDMYLNPDRAIAFFLPSGTPFPYGGGASGGLSATVTIRQDGMDGFIADFQNQYTLSSKAQTLELASRSSVDIEALSQVDWITIIKTKALENKSVMLQIAENTAEGSRTGKVTVSAPALGVSQEVNVIQMGSGDIYIPDNAFRALLLESFDKDSDGILSKAECEAVTEIRLNATEDGRVADIVSIQGVEHFTNLYVLYLIALKPNGTKGALDGTINLSANKKLTSLGVYYAPNIKKVDVSGNRELTSLYLYELGGLSEIAFPDGEDDLPLYMLNAGGSQLGPELDMSRFPALEGLRLAGCKKLKTVWLRTGTVLKDKEIDDGVEIRYKGDNLNTPVEIQDPVLRKYLVKQYDWNNDGVLTKLEARQVTYFNLDKTVLAQVMEEGDTLKSFAGISCLENLEVFIISNPQSWSVNGVNYSRRIKAEFIDEFTRLQKLYYFQVNGEGAVVPTIFYGQIPDGVASMPSIEYFILTNCPLITGDIPESLILNPRPYYMDLTGCGLNSLRITVPSSKLLEYPVRGWDKTYYVRNQKIYHVGDDGGYWCDEKYSTLTFRSDKDGTGPVHEDGEVVVYNQATAGPGANIIITGDGFTAENCTVGGTMETYLLHAASTLLSMEPFNKIKDHLNVYLVYAHSQTEGAESGQTRFSTYYRDPRTDTTLGGDRYGILGFLNNLGLNCQTATIAMLMNSPYYAGYCMNYNYLYPYENYSIGYVPVCNIFEMTLVHEVGGHGFGKLLDEYDGDGGAGGHGTVPSSNWVMSGTGANVDSDCEGDPTRARWAPFYLDPRYASEKLGAYLGGATYDTGVWRPTENSVMRTHWAEGGDRFNAPSREAIWLRAMFLSRDAGTTYSNWQTFYNAQNREDFVSVDLAPAPNQAAAVRTREILRRQIAKPTPRRALPAGRTLPEPKHMPPQLVKE